MMDRVDGSGGVAAAPGGRAPAGTAWHALGTEEACRRLATDPARGLAPSDAEQRLAAYGPNRLAEEKKEPIWEELLEELREPTVLLLLGTGVLYAVWGKLEDAITIFVVILLMAGVEAFNEARAKRAIGSLRKLAEPTASVRRGGVVAEVPVEQVVPGDLVLLAAGRRVPADVRLLEAWGLAVDESSLTGESVPVDKDAQASLAPEMALAERRNLAYAGTMVTRGRGLAIAVATGPASELGRIAGLARSVKPPRTPLQKAMGELSKSLAWLAIGVSVIVPVLGIVLAHQPVNTMILTGLSLAFATIPEELPIIITTVLALGGYRLAKEHAIARDLNAVETLGAVTVIATDKTGTLTENRMAVAEFAPADAGREAAVIGALTSGGAYEPGTVADPMDSALVRTAVEAGVDLDDLRARYPVHDEFTFDAARKMTSVVTRRDGHLWVAAKGAPEAILARSTGRRIHGEDLALGDPDRQEILRQVDDMASRGLRVIALGSKMSAAERLSQDEAETDLVFVGLVGLADPPRKEAQQAVATAQGAGIRAVMITGDHPLTASAVARQVGLVDGGRVVTGAELDALSDDALREVARDTAVYARTTSEHKLRIVRALQANGERVAATGDGVNDAPALAAADIGIAMGETGSDVAREAADLVLADDNFTTIVHAVREGRALYANLQKTVRYYLTCKVALVLSTLVPTLLLIPVPFAPVQIILMELFMDLAAGAAFTAEPPETDLLREGPRDPRARFMDRPMITSILTSSFGLFVAVLVAYLVTWFRSGNAVEAQSIAFFTWLLGHVALALNMRSERQPLFAPSTPGNRFMVGWAAATVVFVVLAATVPALQAALRTVAPTAGQWGMMVGLVIAGTFWMEVAKWVRLGNPKR